MNSERKQSRKEDIVFHRISTTCCMFLLIIVALLLTHACASLVCGSKQKIPINSDPSDVKVTIQFDKERVEFRTTAADGPTKVGIVKKETINEKTPFVLEIPRKTKSVIIRFQKEGYFPHEVILVRTVNGWVWGNLLLGGLIGIGVDFSTGAAYELIPMQVDAILTEMKQQGKVLGTPSGNDLLVLAVASPE